MFQLKIFFSRMDEGAVGPASFQRGEGIENNEDEKDIVGDQDETANDDRVMGGMGTEDVSPASSGEFERGEIDTVEQIDRTTRVMDKATHRNIETAPPPSPEGRVDVDQAVSSGMSNRKPGEDETVQHKERGHSTGAYTDIGAGRSGVTRMDHDKH